jgi:hypothetical protein
MFNTVSFSYNQVSTVCFLGRKSKNPGKELGISPEEAKAREAEQKRKSKQDSRAVDAFLNQTNFEQRLTKAETQANALTAKPKSASQPTKYDSPKFFSFTKNGTPWL